MSERVRLTSRTAEDMKSKPGSPVESKGSGIDNDSYDMNDTGHEKNDPKLEEYAKGGPSEWAEDVNKDKVNKDDQKREDTGHAPLIDKHAAAEAVASAKRLEERAVKCIIASQRMLPGATDEIIEKQAAILMHLPEEGLNATLAYQEGLAKAIAKAASESSEDAEEEDKEEKEAAAKKVLDEKTQKLAALKAEAAELEKEIGTSEKKDEDKEEKEAAKVEDEEKEEKEAAKVEDEEKEEKEAAKVEDEDKEEKEAAKVEDEEKEEKTETEVEASDTNILDQIFSGVITPSVKKGASKLSGMVKKEASEGGSKGLDGLWSAPPDVSNLFQ